MTPDATWIRVRVGRYKRYTHSGIVATGPPTQCSSPHCVHVSDQRNYVKYTFLKVDPAWRRRSAEERAADKREFAAACRGVR